MGDDLYLYRLDLMKSGGNIQSNLYCCIKYKYSIES